MLKAELVPVVLRLFVKNLGRPGCLGLPIPVGPLSDAMRTMSYPQMRPAATVRLALPTITGKQKTKTVATAVVNSFARTWLPDVPEDGEIDTSPAGGGQKQARSHLALLHGDEVSAGAGPRSRAHALTCTRGQPAQQCARAARLVRVQVAGERAATTQFEADLAGITGDFSRHLIIGVGVCARTQTHGLVLSLSLSLTHTHTRTRTRTHAQAHPPAPTQARTHTADAGGFHFGFIYLETLLSLTHRGNLGV